MAYKSREKSFFDEIYPTRIKDTIDDKKEELGRLEEKGKKKFLKFYDFGVSKLRSEIKRRPAQYFFLFITSFLGSVITSAVALFIFTGNVITQFTPRPNQEVKSVQAKSAPKPKIKKYDPLLLASKLRKKEKDFILIDIRSSQDYVRGHIISAINLPVFGTDLLHKNGDINEKEVKKQMGKYIEGEKTIIIYGQNSYSSIPEDIVILLYERFPNVKSLAIGWEEWVHLNK